MTDRTFDATRSYDIATLRDGCEAVIDLTDGATAHGVNREEFERWQREGHSWSFGNDDIREETRGELYRPGATAEEVEEAPRDFEAELTALWAALGQEANSRGWCGEYDQFAADHNGPARPPRQMTRVAYLRVPLRFEGVEGDIDPQVLMMRGTEQLKELVLEALARSTREVGNDSARYLTDYVSILSQGDAGSRLL